MKDIKMHMTYLLSLLLTLMYWELVSACRFQHLEPSLKNNGYITSMDYPELYPPGSCQLWSIQGKPGTKVTIRILDIDLPTRNKDGLCDNDFLLIGPLNQHRYCGNSSTKSFDPYSAVLTSSVNTVFILFNSTDTGTKGTGFYIHYQLFGPELNTVMMPTTSSTAKSDNKDATMSAKHSRETSKVPKTTLSSCHFDIREFEGEIKANDSLFEPLQKYKFCLWHLHPTLPYGTELTSSLIFYVCDLHYKDQIVVYEGQSSHVIGTYDSFTCPNFLTPVGNEIRVVYKPNQELLKSLGVAKFHIHFSSGLHCHTGYRYCGHSEQACYPAYKACDDVWDCPQYGADEKDCSKHRECPIGELSCNTSMKACFKESDRCTGKGECKNYMDEMNCTLDRCSSSQGLFLCRNGRCIYEKWRCDHTRDCEDNSDEENCSTAPSPRVIVAAVVGALTCSLVLVVALGCVCKVYSLRVQQLHGVDYQRPETPLTRLQAELIRRRAPPPPYNEAMLTSRPFDETYQEMLNQASMAFNNTHSGDQSISLTCPPTSRPRYSSRRYRRRNRNHHSCNQELQPRTSGVNAIRADLGIGENLLLVSAEAMLSLETGASANEETREPPPYNSVEPHNGQDLNSSSSDSSDEGPGADADVPLLYLGTIATTDMEMSSTAVGIMTTMTASTSMARNNISESQWCTGGGTDERSRVVVDDADHQDKATETASTSLSMDFDTLPNDQQGEGGEKQDSTDMPIIEEDSDSDCILTTEEDVYCENDNEGNVMDRDSDSDTALLLADV